VKAVSKNINMIFGLEKCERICLKKRVGSKAKYIYTGSIFENDIKELDLREVYKYLGTEESHDIQYTNKKEKVRRMRLVSDTELSAKNKIQAIGSLAVPVFRYSFGIVNWCQEELQTLDRKTRKLLNIRGRHHLKADLDCLYIPRIQGGRG